MLGVVLVASIAAGCSPVRTLDAARLLMDIAGESAPDAVPRTAVDYPGTRETRRAHVYVPSESKAALVLVPGAAEDAMEDPRLIEFAGALGRRGFLVLVPELPGENFLQVSARDSEVIADAARYLLRSGGVDEVGMAALSYAVSPTVQAALEPDLRDRVGYLVAIGGYHDILAGITYITTGAFRKEPGEPWRRGDVDRRAKWVFLRANTAWIDDPEDARLLEAIARTRLARPGADVSALAAQLGPGGRAVYEVFVNDDPNRVPDLVADLPQRVREEIAALDLSTRDLGRLDADLILIHGRNDPLVPHTESLSLARAAGAERSTVYLLEDLEHVDLTAPSPADLVTLLRAAYRVLKERDAAPAPSVPRLQAARPRVGARNSTVAAFSRGPGAREHGCTRRSCRR